MSLFKKIAGLFQGSKPLVNAEVSTKDESRKNKKVKRRNSDHSILRKSKMGKRGAVTYASGDGKGNRNNAIDLEQMGEFEPKTEFSRTETVRTIL